MSAAAAQHTSPAEMAMMRPFWSDDVALPAPGGLWEKCTAEHWDEGTAMQALGVSTHEGAQRS